MRLSGIVVTILAILAASPLWAQRYLQEIDPLTSLRSDARCFILDSRIGWQRMNLKDELGVYLHIFDPDTVRGMDKDDSALARRVGWTVDRARYDHVGALGHTGASAQALAPYSRYKVNKKAAFGALLIRTQDGRTGFLEKMPRQILLDGAVTYIDFRINDSDATLGDNDGHLLLCISQVY